MKMLKSNYEFVMLCLALTGIYFIAAGVMYWLPDYMQYTLSAKPDVVAWYFAAISFTAPVMGVIIGGIVT